MLPPPASRARPHPCSACTVERAFCQLPGALRAVFEGLKTGAWYDRGEVLFHESDASHSVFVVCTGSIKLVTASSEGKLLLLRFAGPGEVLGLAEGVRAAPHEYSAVAAEPSVLAIVPRETFNRFVNSYPEACFRMTVELCEQYSKARREARFLAFGETSTVRLARLLLDWSAETGQAAADGSHVPCHVTHMEIAQSIGSTRETVTRILGSLNHRGIVERTPDEFVIRSAEQLTRLAAY